MTDDTAIAPTNDGNTNVPGRQSPARHSLGNVDWSTMSASNVTRKRLTTIAAAATLTATGIGLSALLPSSAQAIPTAQQSCAFSVLSNTPATGWQPVTSSTVTVNNGASGRYVVVNFNADAGVSPNAELRVGYRVDAGAVQTPGAQNFANHTQYWQTRHSMVVLYVPAGVHQIQPYWRISGAAGTNGVIHSRCLTAEAYTS